MDQVHGFGLLVYDSRVHGTGHMSVGRSTVDQAQVDWSDAVAGEADAALMWQIREHEAEVDDDIANTWLTHGLHASSTAAWLGSLWSLMFGAIVKQVVVSVR